MVRGDNKGDSPGGLGTLLLLNLFRDQVKNGQNADGHASGAAGQR
ncbi:MAG: hypothetical protein U0Z53_14645 [Blastocatellia bacterium]